MRRGSCRILAGLCILLSPVCARGAVDTWTQSTPAGFGAGFGTSETGRAAGFLDASDGRRYAYLGTKNATLGGGVWRSSDGVTWVQFNASGFGTAANENVVGLYATSVPSALLAGVANAAGGEVWRSSGTFGATWTSAFSAAAAGAPQNTSAGTAGVYYRNAFYLGTENATTGGEIWKSTSANWTGAWFRVANAGFGVGTQAPRITFLAQLGSNLYAATGCNAAPCGQLWKSTGTAFNALDYDTWTQVLVASDTLDVGNNTSAITALETFKGFHYLATTRATGGAQVWRTQTPDTPGSWTRVYSPDGDGSTRFAAAGAQSVRALRAFKGAVLYAGTQDLAAGLVVYRSTDGATWTRSNAAAGFGDANNQTVSDFVFTSARNGGSALAGVLNPPNGAAAWRAAIQAPEPASIAGVHVSSVGVSFTLQGSTSTGYQVDAATTSNFSTILISSAMPASTTTTWTLSPQGLLGNTSYFIRAGAVWADATGYVLLGEVTTLPATPTNARALFTSTDTLTITWTTVNGSTPGYRVIVSTAADPSSPGGAAVSDVTVYFAVSVTSAGLTANTTYFFRVAAIGNGGQSSPFSIGGSTFTVPYAPGVPGQPFTAVETSSLTVAWTAGSNVPPGPTVSFDVQLSTGAFPNSNVGNVSILWSQTSVTFGAGLSPALSGNTTYYVRVRALNSGGGGPFSSLGSTVTLAAVPTSPAFSGSFASSITFTWNSAGNGAGVGYRVLVSTADPAAPAGSVVTSSVVYTTSFSSAGLVSDTTYYFRVAAVNNAGKVSENSALAFTFTLPAAPGAAAVPFASVRASSITVAWTAGNPASGPPLRFTATQSTGAFPNSLAGNVSSDTANLFATFGTGGAGAALVPNTTYYYRVQAVNSGGGGDFLAIGSTSTLASLASGVSFSANTASSIVLNWAGAGNGPGALFTVLTSTAQSPSAPAGAVVTSSVTYNTSLSTSGLAANTTYFLQVSAVNNNGLSTGFTAAVSTFTLPLPPAAASPLFASVQLSSLTAAWTIGSNPAGGAPLNYVAELSSGAFPNSFSGNIRTATTPATSVVFGSGGVGASLTPSTTYFVQVYAINAGGAGAAAALGSTATLAAIPVPSAFPTPTAGSIQFSWSTAGNGPALYTVLISTAPDPAAPSGAVVTSSSTYANSVSSSGLVANTTYWFRVGAANPDGVSTALTAAAGIATLANPPTGLALSAVDVSSVTLSWSAASNPPQTTFAARVSTASGGTVLASSRTVATTIALLGLSANSTYFFEVAAVNRNEVTTAYAAGVGTATLAALPSTAAPSGVTNSTITANWGANGNPAGTSYQLQASVDPAFGTINASSTTKNNSALIGGLTPGATYYFRVRAVNIFGVFTAYASLPSTVTLNVPPASPVLSGTALNAASIAWSWPTVFNAEGYRLISTSAVNLSGDLNYLATTYTEAALATNTAYSRAVAGFNGSGASTSTTVTRFTSAAPPASVALMSVFVTSITLQWTSGGNPSGTTYYAMAWPAGGSTTTVAVQLSSAAITGLNTSTTYFVTVQAINGDGLAVASGVTLSTSTLPLPVSSATATPDAGATLVFSPPAGLVTVVVPPGAFSAPVVVTLTTTTLVAAPVSGGGATATGVGVAITIASGEQPLRAVSVTVGFRDSDVAGLDRNTLTLCRYDPLQGVWVPLFSSVDSANNSVTGLTNHLSVFQIFSLTPAATVADVKVFPNPFRPALGHANITFGNLPPGTTLKVYTLLGQLLRTLTANGAGIATWDGNTDAGRPAATGVYVVHAKGGDSRVFRLGIQR